MDDMEKFMEARKEIGEHVVSSTVYPPGSHHYGANSRCSVELTFYEMLLAAHAGVMRQVQNCKDGLAPAYGAGDKNDWQLHIEGCLGECALAKFLGVYWSGKGELRAPDVGIVDVRTTRLDYGDLMMHKRDPDDRVFYLLCGVNGIYKVKGWILAKDGKKDFYWRDPTGKRPAYFVPQHALNPPVSAALRCSPDE